MRDFTKEINFKADQFPEIDFLLKNLIEKIYK